jgi:hypothetical protein
MKNKKKPSFNIHEIVGGFYIIKVFLLVILYIYIL